MLAWWSYDDLRVLAYEYPGLVTCFLSGAAVKVCVAGQQTHQGLFSQQTKPTCCIDVLLVQAMPVFLTVSGAEG